MARVFKFKPGDVVRMKQGDALVTQVNHCKTVFEKHLTVVFCFWDGSCRCYVLNTGEDGICLVSDEERLELEERAPMPTEGAQPDCAKESYSLGYVFRINNRLVAAESIEKSIRIFYDRHRSEAIEKIALQDKDLALIQNLKED
ncbi:MAG: hypothetical protein IK144_12215 [Bacteroidaceae bacterium]|nr:hypothetical protein [Bacteroidaceae bacterium]